MKKYASDFRAEARAALSNRWGIAILVTLLAGFLGGQSSTPSFGFHIDSSSEASLEQVLAMFKANAGDVAADQLLGALSSLALVLIPILLGALALSIVLLLIGPCIHWGLCRFRLALLDGQEPTVGMLFSGFKQVFFKALGLQILVTLVVFATLLAFVIVGAVVVAVVALALPGASDTRIEIAFLAVLFGIGAMLAVMVISYRYSMSFYALVDNPNMGAVDAMRESRNMMKGNKWRLFCLQLSFIGWEFLCVFTCGIGYLWLAPYMGQAEAAFYHDVSRRAAVREAVEGLGEFMQGL